MKALPKEKTRERNDCFDLWIAILGFRNFDISERKDKNRTEMNLCDDVLLYRDSFALLSSDDKI